MLGNLFAQPLSMSSLVYLLVWSPPPHIPYISLPLSVSSFRTTCPNHRNLFCCSINIISSIPSLSLNSLLRTLSFTVTSHIYLTILIHARWSATSFSFLTSQASLLCSILLHTRLLYSLPLLISDISLFVDRDKIDQWNVSCECVWSCSEAGEAAVGCRCCVCW